MAQEVNLQKQVYDKNQYQKVIDNSFTQLGVTNPTSTTVAPLPSVDQFFQYYSQLFFDIPKFGATNSHEYLIKTSQDYIGTTNVVNEEIQALIAELTALRQDNLDLQQSLLDLVSANQNNG